ncbi:MAG: RnfABCDGE type electron transport complex subunit D [Clostridiales bacterium]|nr:RnfABCDGE type electron transport complex subunit D [Candidatus Equinaster intestinalis]
MDNKLTVTSSPHIHTYDSTSSIMLAVIIALVPAAIYGTIIFGWYAGVIILVSVASSLLFEFLWNRIMKKPNSLGDLSAVVTGLLLALNLPPRVPLYVPVIGSLIAIIVVKQMFGGLGNNFVNPAIAARIVLMVSFPKLMTEFYEPFSEIVSSATPLASGTQSLKELFLGMHAGCIGETSVLLLAICGIGLIVTKIIDPIIPFTYIGTVFLLSWAFGMNPLYAVMSGGLMIGAFFMATDYVTSPTFPLGKLIFGIGCGLLTVVIRKFASLPEGVSYSILLMNILVPHIDNLTAIKPFGKVGAKKNG